MKTSIRTLSAESPAGQKTSPADRLHACPLYDLISGSGLTVSILPLGASIQKISVMDPDGQELSIALGFPDLPAYEELICYAGATLGPNAGRIRDARLPVLGSDYPLSENDNGSQLHGGCHNLSSTLWNVDSVTCTDDTASVLLSCKQPDGLDGYPGNRRYQVLYTFTEPGLLTIDLAAWSDRPTYINLSNHTYWNLSGDFTRPALEQELIIHADQVCVNDEDHLPVAVVPAAGTAFDFQKRQSLASAIASAQDPVSLEQLRIGKGYNHAWLLQSSPGWQNPLTGASLAPACVLQDPVSKRAVRILTDAPAVVLYSGGYLPEGLLLQNGQHSVPSCAVALEAQDVPDTPHLLPSACQLTLPERPFHRIIQYQIL